MLKSLFITLCLVLFASNNIYADSTPNTQKGTLSYIAKPQAATDKNTTVVNINTATAEQLADALVGVGAKKAADIVQWRRQFGPFKHIYQLTEVRGIGEKTVKKNKDRIRLE